MGLRAGSGVGKSEPLAREDCSESLVPVSLALMPGPGRPFTSETARAAVKRHRSLKSWRTKRERGSYDILMANLNLYNRYARGIRRLYAGLSAIETGCSSNRPCACHHAALYAWNHTQMKAQLDALLGQLRTDMQENRKRWQAEMHACAVAAAAAKLDE